MREEDGVWFAKWEEELPSPDELMPLSQTLITPDLAVAFDISDQKPPVPAPVEGGTNSSPELGGSGAAGGDEPARTLKRPRLVWTPQLHKFVDAVAHLGIKNAVPKTIMQLMSFDGLTRENVASHLQKYRLYLKRMQGLSSGGGGVADAATEDLFASSPVPAHFLHPGRASSEHFVPFLPQQMAIVGAHPHLQSHYHRQMAHLPNGQFDYPFLSRQTQQQQQQGSVHRVGGLMCMVKFLGTWRTWILPMGMGEGKFLRCFQLEKIEFGLLVKVTLISWVMGGIMTVSSGGSGNGNVDS